MMTLKVLQSLRFKLKPMQLSRLIIHISIKLATLIYPHLANATLTLFA